MTGEHQSVRFEERDISVRNVLFIGFGVLLCTIAIVNAMYFFFSYMRHQKALENPPASQATQTMDELPPEPRLQASPYEDYKSMKSAADWQLHHYRWIDKGKGTVAIPIDRAMDLLVQRGIPPSTAPINQFYAPREGDRLTGFEERQEPQP